jgi:hypothetical protein
MSSSGRHVGALFRSRFVARYPGEQLRERSTVDVHRSRTRASYRQLEHGLVQPLVQQAKAVTLEPEHFDACRTLVGEHEQRATLHRVGADPLARRLREAIETVPQVYRRCADEDANTARDPTN